MSEPGTPEGEQPDLGGMFDQVMQMQQQMLEAQQQAAQTEVEGQSGGGVVRVVLTGELDVRAVHIDPAVVDPDDVEMLQDLVRAAMRDAVTRADELRASMLGGGMPDVGSLLQQVSGSDLLGDLLGGQPPGETLPAVEPPEAPPDDERQ